MFCFFQNNPHRHREGKHFAFNSFTRLEPCVSYSNTFIAYRMLPGAAAQEHVGMSWRVQYQFRDKEQISLESKSEQAFD